MLTIVHVLLTTPKNMDDTLGKKDSELSINHQDLKLATVSTFHNITCTTKMLRVINHCPTADLDK